METGLFLTCKNVGNKYPRIIERFYFLIVNCMTTLVTRYIFSFYLILLVPFHESTVQFQTTSVH